MGMFPYAPVINSPWIMHIKQLLNHWSLSYIYYNTVTTLDPGEVILAVKESINDCGIYRNREKKFQA